MEMAEKEIAKIFVPALLGSPLPSLVVFKVLNDIMNNKEGFFNNGHWGRNYGNQSYPQQRP